MARIKRGFQFDEVMRGTYALTTEPDRERGFVFTAHLTAPSLLAHLRTGGMELTGTLEMEGFADDVPIRGRLTMLPWTKKIVRYEFEFTANDRKRYRFVGQKNIKFGRLRESFTTLPGRILDADGREIASALSYFDLSSDFRQFAASWRPA